MTAGYTGHAVVRDDGNSLHEFGSANHEQAKVMYLLNQGDVVTVKGGADNWPEIITADGVHGWVQSACLNTMKWGEELRMCPDYLPRRFPVDFDGEGNTDGLLFLVDHPSMDGGEGIPELRDTSNAVLWRSQDVDEPIRFNCRDWGAYWPEVVGDVDGDGAVDIVASESQSDVAPSSIFISRWTGIAFEPVIQGASFVETPMGSGNFQWTDTVHDFEPRCWIRGMKSVESPGVVDVSVYKFTEGESALIGVARVDMSEKSARILHWLEPLREP